MEVNQLAWAFRRAFDEQLVRGGGTVGYMNRDKNFCAKKGLPCYDFLQVSLHFGSSFLVLFKSFLFGLFEFSLFGLFEFGLVCLFIRQFSHWLVLSYIPSFPSFPDIFIVCTVCILYLDSEPLIYKLASQVVAFRIALQDDRTSCSYP